jgi:hypothetical protein
MQNLVTLVEGWLVPSDLYHFFSIWILGDVLVLRAQCMEHRALCAQIPAQDSMFGRRRLFGSLEIRYGARLLQLALRDVGQLRSL